VIGSKGGHFWLNNTFIVEDTVFRKEGELEEGIIFGIPVESGSYFL